MICAPNKIKIMKKAFIHLFRTHLVITISEMVLGRLGILSRIEVFLHQE